MPDLKAINDKFKGYDQGPPLKCKEYLYGWYPPKKDIYKQSQRKQTSYDLECFYKHSQSRFIDNKHGLKTPKPPKQIHSSADQFNSRSSSTRGSLKRETAKREEKPRKKNLYVVTYDTPVFGQPLVKHGFGGNDNIDKKHSDQRSSSSKSSDVENYSMVPKPPTYKGNSKVQSLRVSSAASSSKQSRRIPHKTWSMCVSETNFKVLDYVNELTTNPEDIPKVQDVDALSEVGSVRSLKSAKSMVSNASTIIRKLANGRHTQMSQNEPAPCMDDRSATRLSQASFIAPSTANYGGVASPAVNCTREPSITPTYNERDLCPSAAAYFHRNSPSAMSTVEQAVSRSSSFLYEPDHFDTVHCVMKQGNRDGRSCSESVVSSSGRLSKTSSMGQSRMPVNQYTAYQAMYNPALHTLKWRVNEH